MADIININSCKSTFLVVDSNYINTLKTIIQNHEKISKTQEIVITSLLHFSNILIEIAKQGNYGENTDKVMLEIENWNKVIEVYKNTKY